MAEALVLTIKRDYVRVSPRPNAEAVLRQLPSWIAHYNEVHPARGSRISFTPKVHFNLRKTLTVSGCSGATTEASVAGDVCDHDECMISIQATIDLRVTNILRLGADARILYHC
jgi:hypothetical protein